MGGTAVRRWLSGIAAAGLVTVFLVGVLSVVSFVSVPAWIERGTVIPNGAVGDPDAHAAGASSVLQESTGLYRMWYSGWGDTAQGDTTQILYASSGDGVAWTKHGVVLAAGLPPHGFADVYGPSVLKGDSGYDMWFSGNGSIYHAASGDGVSWSIDGLALARGVPGAWDEGWIYSSSVVRDPGGGYRLYYEARGADENGYEVSRGIGLAQSAGLLGFERYGSEPVFGEREGVAGVGTPHVVVGTPWTMYYSRYAGGFIGIETATSAGGLAWRRVDQKPILVNAFSPALLDDPSGPRLYYSTFRGAIGSWGLYTIAMAVPSTITVPPWTLPTPLTIVLILTASSGAFLWLLWLGAAPPRPRAQAAALRRHGSTRVSHAYFSIGCRTRLPHSVHEPS